MTWRRALVAGCVAYALARFAVSGVYTPLGEPNLAQVEVWVAPLRLAQRTGGAVELSKPTPYGPVFFATMAPLLRCCGAEPRRLALGLYALQLVALAAALLFTWRSIRGWFIPGADRRGDGIGRGEALALMLFLWLTFAPLYYIMSTKNVETWELGLLAAGLAAYLRGWRSAAGLCVAAAALTKTIPFFFLLYFLIRDRRTLLHTVGWTAGILSLGHVLFGPALGLLYLPSMMTAGLGDTYALAWHENLSLKGLVIKAFGGWHVSASHFTPLSPAMLKVATVVGQAVQAIAVAWTGYLLYRIPRREPGDVGHARSVAWGWSLTAVMMLLVSPNAGHEYMTLTLTAFSVGWALVLTADRLCRDRRVLGLLAAATVLVGIVLPRQVFNRVFPLDWLNRLAGNTGLNPSETYQAFGFPTLGLLCLVAVLALARRDAVATGSARGPEAA